MWGRVFSIGLLKQMAWDGLGDTQLEELVLASRLNLASCLFVYLFVCSLFLLKKAWFDGNNIKKH